jgi:hypothetical protein
MPVAVALTVGVIRGATDRLRRIRLTAERTCMRELKNFYSSVYADIPFVV